MISRGKPICAGEVVNQVILGLLDYEQGPASREGWKIDTDDKWKYSLIFASQQLPEKPMPGQILDHLAETSPHIIC